MLTFGSLFAGIGGIDLGLERAGMRCAWQVEIDDYATRVLAKHWPGVPRFRDVRECGTHNLPAVDLIAGGFPCQPHSTAGRRKGAADDRNLWPEFARIIRELRPRWVLAENVPGLLSTDSGRFYGAVLGELAALGYNAEWECIPAAAVGAPHIRDRVYIVAHADRTWDGGPQHEVCTGRHAPLSSSTHVAHTTSKRGRHLATRRPDQDAAPDVNGRGQGVADAECDGWQQGAQNVRGRQSVAADGGDCCRSLPHSDRERCDRRGGVFQAALQGGRLHAEGNHAWTVEPDVGRMAHGIPSRVDRLRGLGNAVVPQVAELIGRWIVECAGAQEQRKAA